MGSRSLCQKVLERTRQAVRDERSAAPRLKMCSRAWARCLPTMRAIRNANGLEHALLFKKLPRPPRKSGGLFQATGLLEEELLQLGHLGVIEGGASNNRRWPVGDRM
jgi:hypothetical protein